MPPDWEVLYRPEVSRNWTSMAQRSNFLIEQWRELGPSSHAQHH